MIPSFEDVVDRWRAILGGTSVIRAHESLIRDCLIKAESLIEDQGDEPAALFYVFAERAHAFASDFPAFFVDWLTVTQLKTLGLPLPADWNEFRCKRGEVTLGLVSFEEVRDWFEWQYELGITRSKGQT